jgi:polyhydroxybutyrate depolymerase
MVSRPWHIVAGAGLLILLTACSRGTLSRAEDSMATPGEAGASAGSKLAGTLEVEGGIRSYRLHVPTGYDPSVPVALVVALHGGGGNGAGLEAHVGLDAIAGREGFLVVYPDGSGRLGDVLLTWNSGNCCGFALDQPVDDVAFIRALVSHLSLSHTIDPARVYATGMSNGGMMSYRLACEASDLFAAVAPVAGALNVDCEPSEPLSVLAIHATADQHVLFEGGAPAVSVDSHERVDRSVHYAMTFWAARDGCALEPTTERGGTVIHEVYPDCDTGLAVELLAVEGGGHAWPGGESFSQQGDEPSLALDASEAIWAFFEAHPKPQRIEAVCGGSWQGATRGSARQSKWHIAPFVWQHLESQRAGVG